MADLEVKQVNTLPKNSVVLSDYLLAIGTTEEYQAKIQDVIVAGLTNYKSKMISGYNTSVSVIEALNYVYNLQRDTSSAIWAKLGSGTLDIGTSAISAINQLNTLYSNHTEQQNRDIADINSALSSHAGSIGSLSDKVGNTTLTTTDKTVSGAINELKSDLQSLESAFQEIDGRLTQTEKNLMTALFNAIPYTADVHNALDSLTSIWAGETVANYTVTLNLMHCVSSNNATSAAKGEAFTATITGSSGYDVASITVTMGGADITSSVVSENIISIPAVTGNVVITASATRGEYTPVEYITQSANGAHIDTNYYPTPTDVVECTFAAYGSGQWTEIFSANLHSQYHYELTTRPDNTAGRTVLTRSAKAWNTTNDRDPNFVCVPETVYKFVESTPGVGTIYDSSNNALVTLTDSGASSLTTAPAKIFLFGRSSSNSFLSTTSFASGIRLYDFGIKNNNGDYVHHYIPSKDGNGIACLYDTIDRTFLYDGSGNNNFTAGPEVA